MLVPLTCSFKGCRIAVYGDTTPFIYKYPRFFGITRLKNGTDIEGVLVRAHLLAYQARTMSYVSRCDIRTLAKRFVRVRMDQEEGLNPCTLRIKYACLDTLALLLLNLEGFGEAHTTNAPNVDSRNSEVCGSSYCHDLGHETRRHIEFEITCVAIHDDAYKELAQP